MVDHLLEETVRQDCISCERRISYRNFLNLIAFLEQMHSPLELCEVLTCRKLFDFFLGLYKKKVKWSDNYHPLWGPMGPVTIVTF
jgi:hypothetical protein